MSYSRETYILAQAKLENRRRDAEDALDVRRERAYSAIPELIEIQSEIAKCGTEAINAFAKGGDGQAFIEKLAKKSLAAQGKRRELLRANGLPEDYLEPHYTCSVCGDTGVTDDGICGCQRLLLIETAIDEIAKCAPIKASTFENFSLDFYPDTAGAAGINPKKRMGEIAAFCKNYAEDFSINSPSLFMHGATGLGKTHLSLAVAEKAIRRGAGVIYSSAPNLFASLERVRFGRQTYEDSRSEQDVLNTDLLIVDDLGAEFSTQFTVSCVYNIVNTRLLSGKPTIISTNLTPTEFEEKYTQRITSRITGNYMSLMFVGKDIRQLKNY